MNVIEMGSAVVGRCLTTAHDRVRGGIEQTVPDPLIGGGRAVVRGVADIAGRLVDIPEELRQRVTVTALLTDTDLNTDRARQAHLDAARGDTTVTTLRAHPPLARALDGLRNASTRIDQRVQDVADELHDSSKELLGRAIVSATAARRWVLWPTPERTRTLLNTIGHRPTPGHLTPDDLIPSPATSPGDRVIIEQATGVLAQRGGVDIDAAWRIDQLQHSMALNTETDTLSELYVMHVVAGRYAMTFDEHTIAIGPGQMLLLDEPSRAACCTETDNRAVGQGAAR